MIGMRQDGEIVTRIVGIQKLSRNVAKYDTEPQVLPGMVAAVGENSKQRHIRGIAGNFKGQLRPQNVNLVSFR